MKGKLLKKLGILLILAILIAIGYYLYINKGDLLKALSDLINKIKDLINF